MYFPNDEVTRYAFMSHMEAYIKQLLNDATKANVDDFLKSHGFDNEKALNVLLKRTDPNDEYSAIIIRSEKIRPETDEEGNETGKDRFVVKYKLPRKDYMKKMRNLYISLFENHSKGNPINEGAWGKGVLENDAALDYQSEFGANALRKFYADINNCTSSDMKWSRCGVVIDFLKKYKNDEVQFTDEYNDMITFIRQKLDELYRDKNFINSWKNPSEMESKLKHLDKELSGLVYEKDILNTNRFNTTPQSMSPNFIQPNLNMREGKINEDGEGGAIGGDSTMADMGGATNASSSGQFIQPMKSGKTGTDVIKRRTVYISEEQRDFIKRKLNEDSPNVMDTGAGDFGYDAPASVCDPDDPTLDHENMMKKSWEEGQ